METATAAQNAARRISLNRARYLDTGDEYAREAWQDASTEYFNITGREHPMGMQPLTDAEYFNL